MSAYESRVAAATSDSPVESPTPQPEPRAAVWPWLSALVLLGGFLVFYRLGGGPIEVYDEGLYGRHAQSALAHHVYLHAVDTHGSFPTGDIKFSKPPLSIWVTAASFALFGPTLFALRLPFALATFLSALIAFAWGLRLQRGRAGPWLGFSWGLLFLASHGAYHFGRTATIDALLLAFVMLALYAHARAIESRGLISALFCLLAGSGIALAFLTKQVVCVLAALPIAMVELSRMRSEGFLRPFVRASLSLGMPLAIAAAWVAMLWSKLGPATRDVLWSHAIVKRVRGFDGIHHHNYLNRIAEQLDLDAAPFAWSLGLFGLILFVAECQRARRNAADAWLLFGTFACSWLAFDAGSQAILPWYAFTLLMPLAFGNALMITRGCAALLAFAETQARPPWTVLSSIIAVSGAAALLMAVSDATRTFLPAPLTAAALSALIAACAYAAPSELLLRRAAIALGVAFVLGLSGLFLRERYDYVESEPTAVLGAGLAALGATRISVDTRANIHDYTRVTFFGVKAVNEGPPPWSGNGKGAKRKSADARVESEVLPREAHGIDGQRILRAAGMFAVFGPLNEHPFTLERAEAALAAGPLTYEAEDLASTRFDTLVYRASASGGALRRMASWPRRRPESFKLATGTLSELPRGTYSAQFEVHADCGLFRGTHLGEITLSNLGSPIITEGVQCAANSSEGGPVSFKFTLVAPSRLGVSLRYDQGTIDFDRFTLKRETMPP
jgi:4-amino-4-deoxy-L-arabinose transferase-like glycosyltransferase